jgi:hypothetical protein
MSRLANVITLVPVRVRIKDAILQPGLDHATTPSNGFFE